MRHSLRKEILAPLAKLSPRERDCLSLLVKGLTTRETREELGVAPSTLSAHLYSARRKLGVRTTTQAVLTFAGNLTQTSSGAGEVRAISSDMVPGALTAPQISFVDRLSATRRFSEAWDALLWFSQSQGICGINLGATSDPWGRLEHGSYAVRLSFPDEAIRIYHDSGGAPADPVAHFALQLHKPAALDPEAMPKEFRQPFGAMSEFAEYIMDCRLNRMAYIPGRDPPSSAPYGIIFVHEYCTSAEFDARTAAHTPMMAWAMKLFWEHIQSCSMLADVPHLSRRERDALQLVTRGFAVSEMAEHLKVSKRATEKLLAAARTKLGARNNAQAIYRAMFFRALG